MGDLQCLLRSKNFEALAAPLPLSGTEESVKSEKDSGFCRQESDVDFSDEEPEYFALPESPLQTLENEIEIEDELKDIMQGSDFYTHFDFQNFFKN